MMVNMHPDIEADIPRDAPATGRRVVLLTAFGALLVCTVLVAAVTFALSFYGLEDFGRTGMQLPVPLSWLVPIGVDLFSLCGIAATYLLRDANWRVRLYAWAVFLVPTGLSVAGNMAHAQHRQMDSSGVVGAAVAPVLLALATHLVVVVRRHLQADTDPDMDEGTDIDPYPQVSGPADVDGADSEEVTQMARALVVRRRGGTVAEQAAAAGVAERTVRRWFEQPSGRPGRRPVSRRATPTRHAPADSKPDTAPALEDS